MNSLFLDIEGTIIKSLDEQVFLSDNVEMIRRVITEGQVDSFHIFSFAWHDEKDIDQTLLSEFEEMFGVKFRVILKNSLRPIFEKHLGKLDDMDFADFSNSKSFGFQLLMCEISQNPELKQEMGIGENVCLIDDRVENFSFSFGDVKAITVKI